MQNLAPRLSDKDATVMALALLMTPDQADYLYQFLPEADAAALSEETARLSQTPYENLVPALQGELRAMLDYDYHKDLLSTIHSEWLARLLQNERPHVIVRILEGFPDLIRNELTSYIPKGLLLRLPKTSQLPPISPQIRRALVNAYMKKFQAIGGGDEGRTFMFRNIANLDGEDLVAVIKEVGLTLFATAFQGVDPRALQKLCARMPREDERELTEATRSLQQLPAEDVKRAQKSILALDMSSTREGWLFKKAGLRRVGECLAMEHPRMGEHVCYKLEKETGELLLAALEDFRKQGAFDIMERLRLQDFIVRCVQKLALAERLDPKWRDSQFLLYFGAPN
jgi:flagellar FliG-like protein